MSKLYVVYRIEVTKPEHAIDHKRHSHKLYLYPVPRHLADLVRSCWDKREGKRGAVKFTTKAEALRVARHYDAKVEEA